MLRHLLLTSAVLLLTACGPSTPSLPKTEPVVLPELPENLRSCDRLRSISSRVGDREDLAVGELRAIWAQDRAVASQCFRRLDGVVSFYDGLRTNLMNPDISPEQ